MENDPLSFWRLAPELTVVDAAILVAGGDPNVVDREDRGTDFESVYVDVKRTTGHANFTPVFTALKSAILRKDLPALLRYKGKKGGDFEPSPENPYWIVSPRHLETVVDPQIPHLTKIVNGGSSVYIEAEPDWDASSVVVTDLRSWLSSQGCETGFFFPPRSRETAPDCFMEPSHDHFSSELALAVAAWRGLALERRFPRGPKAAIEAWIDANRDAWLGEDGLSINARKRVVTLVNWEKKGGAPRSGS